MSEVNPWVGISINYVANLVSSEQADFASYRNGKVYGFMENGTFVTKPRK